jgi:hypothetical protein
MCELLHTSLVTKKQRRGRAATKDDYAAVTGRPGQGPVPRPYLAPA